MAKGEESAFPAFEHCADHMRGLTKREYIAVKAMQAFCANPKCHEMTFVEVARAAFQQADAMLSEGKSDD